MSTEEKDPVWDALLISEVDKVSRKQQITFINSSTLNEARYDPLLQTLTVTFKTSTGSYSYFDVPSDVANTLFALAKEGSAGKYFINNVKNVYPFKRIT